MNRDTIIGTLLISILIFWYVSNSAKNASEEAEEKIATEQIEKEKVAEKEEETSIVEELAAAEGDSAALSSAEEKLKAKFGSFYKSVNGIEQSISLENKLVKIEISNKGAQIKQVNLKDFTTWDKKPLKLINESQDFNFSFKTADNRVIETKNMYYSLEKIGDNSVSLKLKINDNKYIEHIYSLNPDSYFLDFELNFNNLEADLAPEKELKAEWNYDVIQQEKGLSFERQKSTVYWKINEDEYDNLSPGASKDDVYESAEWIAFKDQFFNSTFIADEGLSQGKVKSIFDAEDSTKVASYNTSFNFKKQANNHYKFQYFFGPNDYKMLKSFENGQENIVELSSSFFLFKWVKHITKWVIIPIFRFLDGFNLNYGIIIILLTLIIRMALMPLTFKSYVSSAKTKLLKPQLDKLKEKYKDDQQKYAAEQMKLYQSSGVSMFGGCLPMLLQMPFFLAMFYFFPSSIELRQQSFLWATDLSTYDVLFHLPFNIPIYGAHVSGFTLLMTISSLVSARFNPQMQNNNTQPGMEMMKYMPYFFPIFLMVLFNSWSAALTFYYFVSNLITLGQQLFINKFLIDEEKLKLQLEENKKKPQKKGGFRNKMEEIYKQQQAQEQNKKKR